MHASHAYVVRTHVPGVAGGKLWAVCAEPRCAGGGAGKRCRERTHVLLLSMSFECMRPLYVLSFPPGPVHADYYVPAVVHGRGGGVDALNSSTRIPRRDMQRNAADASRTAPALPVCSSAAGRARPAERRCCATFVSSTSSHMRCSMRAGLSAPAVAAQLRWRSTVFFFFKQPISCGILLRQVATYAVPDVVLGGAFGTGGPA